MPTQGDSMSLKDEMPTAPAGDEKPADADVPADASADGELGVRGAVVQAMLAARLTQSDLAREVGLSQSALSRWLRGDYKGDNDAIRALLATWLQSRDAHAAQADEAEPVQWVETPTGLAIEKALAYARNRGKIALIYGGAGVGKTTALTRFARETPNVWIATASPAVSSMAGMLRELCRVMGLNASGWKNSALSSDVARRLAGARSLVIVDEAQHLSVPALEQLRYIHDQAGAGLVLSGNERVFSLLNGGHTRNADFAQLYSRIGRRLRVSIPTDGDIGAVLDAWHVTGKPERAYAAQIASLPGGLRGLFHLLEEARMAAQGMGLPMDARLLRAAWADLGGV